MTEGIAYMHNLNIWHRDVKLENVLFCNGSFENPQIKICDFGFSKKFEEGERSIEFIGTPLYAAPEIYHHLACMYFFLFFNNNNKEKKLIIN